MYRLVDQTIWWVWFTPWKNFRGGLAWGESYGPRIGNEQKHTFFCRWNWGCASKRSPWVPKPRWNGKKMFQVEKKQVDGSEIRRSPVEVGSFGSFVWLFTGCRISSFNSMWWFQILVFFPHTWRNDPIWLYIFQLDWSHQLATQMTTVEEDVFEKRNPKKKHVTCVYSFGGCVWIHFCSWPTSIANSLLFGLFSHRLPNISIPLKSISTCFVPPATFCEVVFIVFPFAGLGTSNSSPYTSQREGWEGIAPKFSPRWAKKFHQQIIERVR